MVMFDKCCLFWLSNLQTYISFYALHYGYVVFSCYFIDILPFKNPIKEVIYNLGVDSYNNKFF